ncbi:MAG: hypothetical protein HN382_08200 [Gammaproteobacteria bacterium]|nr:hypothetical protein [Gammaproteobacteria bacterium]MBT4081622.1 hypothetical protein [Gammaproteobacteria bacterium]MBT4330511.1 hypothetical protein [Gammaproteobacteria bacterium]MBT5635975.1 hypothetical protein [Gammaproteobacteria bacterium]MBT6652426.1 hypothetical protein [Gammaproteobacteria bacterium]
MRKIITARHLTRTTPNWHKIIDNALSEHGVGCRCDPAKSNCDPQIFAHQVGDKLTVSCSHFNFVLPSEETQTAPHILQHIDYRNRLTQRVLELINRYRKPWLALPDALLLSPWDASQVIAAYNDRWDDFELPASTLSRLINHTQVRVHGQRILMKQLFPGRMRWIGEHLRRILASHPLLTDRELRDRLGSGYDIHISTRHINECRKKMGIPARKERLGNSTPNHFLVSQCHLVGWGRYWRVVQAFMRSVNSGRSAIRGGTLA